MKDLGEFTPSRSACRAEVEEFRALLDSKTELGEQEDILPFFRARPNLSAMTGMVSLDLWRIDRLAFEYDLFGDFRCDLVVGDFQTPAYTLIEFEEARADSVFCPGKKYTQEWSPRFERGYSQLIDWFWKIHDLEKTGDFQHRFGAAGDHLIFHGVLIVGRSRFLESREKQRMRWRSQRVSVNTHKMTCMTYDDLLEDLSGRLTNLERLAAD